MQFYKAVRNKLCSVWRDERGAYLAFTVVAMPLVLTLMGLVIDGGLMFRSQRRAIALTSAAAHVGAQQIDETFFIATNQVRLDYGGAARAANEFLTRNAPDYIRPAGVSVWGDQVRVSAVAEIPTYFLRIFGIGTVRVSVSALARPQHGIEELGQ
ncbi:MAG: pilus assembly protein TadG-related protein [Chloroflexota bacterium]